MRQEFPEVQLAYHFMPFSTEELMFWPFSFILRSPSFIWCRRSWGNWSLLGRHG